MELEDLERCFFISSSITRTVQHPCGRLVTLKQSRLCCAKEIQRDRLRAHYATIQLVPSQCVSCV